MVEEHIFNIIYLYIFNTATVYSYSICLQCFGVYGTTIAKQDSRMPVFADDQTGQYPGPQCL